MINASTVILCMNSVDDETLRILAKHGYFNSHHEFYAVLKEEFEETMENSFKFNQKIMKLWSAVRKDDTNCIKLNADELYKISFDNLCEWVQVCAVIQKYKRGVEND